MRNITVDFDPQDFEYYLNGPKYHSVLHELNQRLRSKVKYEEEGLGNDHETVQQIREELFEIWDANIGEDL